MKIRREYKKFEYLGFEERVSFALFIRADGLQKISGYDAGCPGVR